TRTRNGDEISLFSDLSKYDEDLFTECGKDEVKYLDEINYSYEIKKTAEHFTERVIKIQNSRVPSKSYGTLIKISSLKKGGLDLKKIDEIINDVNKLSSPFSEENVTQDFLFDLLINNTSRFKED